MAKKQANSIIDQAKSIMDENIHIARFNETQRNLDKLKNHFITLTDDNDRINHENDKLKGLVDFLKESNNVLHDHVLFLEEIINSLQVIVSIKDLNKKNMLWYNQNYNRMLGYKHKELQELSSDKAFNMYHPDDRQIIEDRNKYMSDSSNNRYSCTLRLRHKNGKWVKMNSDLIVLKRNPDGSLSKAMEILSNMQ
jgi:PAS domain S-box-containing protein